MSALLRLQGLLVWNPFRKAPGGSQLIIEALVKSAQPFDGNSCPFNATNPLEGCEPGYFCPSPAEQLPCPAGFYCPVSRWCGVFVLAPGGGGQGKRGQGM